MADGADFGNGFSATPLAEHAILLRRRFKHTITVLQRGFPFGNSHRLATFNRPGEFDCGHVSPF